MLFVRETFLITDAGRKALKDAIWAKAVAKDRKVLEAAAEAVESKR